MKKFIITKEELYEQYIIQNQTAKKIAEHHDVDVTTVEKRLKFFGITKKKVHKVPREELIEYYINQNLSQVQIAEKYNVSKTTIYDWLKKEGIQKPKELVLRNHQEQVRKTCLKKYGVEYPIQIPEVKEKIKNTSLEKYGVESPLKIPKNREKIKQTNLKKYGAECSLANAQVRKKVAKTNLKRYGSIYPTQNNEVKERIKIGMLNKYGAEYCVYVPDILEKQKSTMLKKYGVPYLTQLPEFREKVKQTNLKKYGVENILNLPEFREKAKHTMLDKYGVPYFCLTEKYQKATKVTISKTNLHWKTKLEELGYVVELEKKIGNRSYDLHLAGTKILLEINPSATHSSTMNIMSKSAKPKDIEYHMQKSLLAKENGYHCIHIWDWDKEDKILNLLKKKKKVLSKELSIYELSESEVFKFVKEYSLIGHIYEGQISYGAFYNNTLIQVMTFRYLKDDIWRVTDYIIHPSYYAANGGREIFDIFEETYKPKKVFWEVDFSKYSGSICKALNFTFKEYKAPEAHFIDFRNKEIRVWDCGYLYFEWKY